LITQSLNQLDNIYGPHNAIFDNCHVRIAFAANDDRTARRIADLLGTATELRQARTLMGDRFALWLTRTTVSQTEVGRPLLTPGEIMQLSEREALVLLGNLPPIRAQKVRYFQDRTFRERVWQAPPLTLASRSSAMEGRA
jgi:type IV secretion system protein VirD4